MTEIRKLEEKDIPIVGDLLIKTLNGSLLQKLGLKFVNSYFLPQALKQTELNNFVYIDKTKVIGYLLIAKHQHEMQQLGKAITHAIFFYTLIRSWRYPSLFIDLIAGFFNKCDLKGYNENILENSTYVVYLSIDPNYQAKGIGSKFLTACLEKIPAKSYIVETNVTKVIKFYEKNNFKPIGIRRRFFSSYTLLLKQVKNLGLT